MRGFSAMAGADKRPDLVIVARGGGSIEDLWSFNEEIVVRAIAESAIPVISAVGHETDTTLADFAADWRAPTPTAAAERAVPVREELLGQVAELGLRLRRAALRPLTMGRERLEARVQRLPRPEGLLTTYAQRLDDQGERLRRALSDRVAIARGALLGDRARLSAPLLLSTIGRARDRLGAVRLSPALVTGQIARGGERLEAVSRLMVSLNPDNVLQRGYVRVTAADGRTLVSAAAAGREPGLSLHFRDGKLEVAPQGSRPPRAAPAARPAAPDGAPDQAPVQGKLL